MILFGKKLKLCIMSMEFAAVFVVMLILSMPPGVILSVENYAKAYAEEQNEILSDEKETKGGQNNVNTIRYVIPGGDALGVKLLSDGIMVVSVSEVMSENSEIFTPAADAGIMMGDTIVSANGEILHSNEEFSDIINRNDNIHLVVLRNNEYFTTDVSPKLNAADGKKRIGMWTKDSAAGIGTMTFYLDKENVFASLGHAICENDTGNTVQIADGKLMDCRIIGVDKGRYGIPGELKGCISSKETGNILSNNAFGIYGKLFNGEKYKNREAVPVATRYNVKTGSASILCDIDGNGVKEYSINISDVSKSPVPDNKGMIIEITDEKLLEMTGGIVQGLSGAPIMQNGAIVGAVTYVFVNNPCEGYGVFIENMLSEADKIK